MGLQAFTVAITSPKSSQLRSALSGTMLRVSRQVGIELTRGRDRERGYTEIGQIGRSFDRENLVIESGEG